MAVWWDLQKAGHWAGERVALMEIPLVRKMVEWLADARAAL